MFKHGFDEVCASGHVMGVWASASRILMAGDTLASVATDDLLADNDTFLETMLPGETETLSSEERLKPIFYFQHLKFTFLSKLGILQNVLLHNYSIKEGHFAREISLQHAPAPSA